MHNRGKEAMEEGRRVGRGDKGVAEKRTHVKGRKT